MHVSKFHALNCNVLHLHLQLGLSTSSIRFPIMCYLVTTAPNEQFEIPWDRQAQTDRQQHSLMLAMEGAKIHCINDLPRVAIVKATRSAVETATPVWWTARDTACVKAEHTLITERRVLELIPVLGSQPAGDVSHKPGGRLPLLSVRPAVTLATLKRAATNFAAWWTEAQWVRAVCPRTAIWTQALLRLSPAR